MIYSIYAHLTFLTKDFRSQTIQSNTSTLLKIELHKSLPIILQSCYLKAFQSYHSSMI